MRNRFDTIRLLLGVGVSLVLHAMVVVPAFVTVLTDQSDAPASADQHSASSQDESRKTPPKDRKMELGLEKSDASTMTWIGYEEYREHLARLAEVEQAAFMTDPVGQPNASLSNNTTLSQQSTSSQQPSEQDDQTDGKSGAPEQADELLLPSPSLPGPVLTPPTDALTQVADDAEPAPPLADESQQKPEAPTAGEQNKPGEQQIIAIRNAWRELFASLLQALAQRNTAETRETTSSKNERNTESQDQPAQSESTAAAKRGEQRQAAQSDKQSDATSTVDVPLDKIDPGQPLAAQGMELKPKRPEFTVFQRVTASPGNPVGEITFNHQGVPINVNLIKTSYVASVDQSVKDSLYAWRAAGKPIDALEAGQTVSIRIRIILNPYAR